MDVDILLHRFVPSHEILHKNEAKELLEQLGVGKEKLPKILASDPVVKKVGAKQGDILKIMRKSPTAGQTIYYRVVV